MRPQSARAASHVVAPAGLNAWNEPQRSQFYYNETRAKAMNFQSLPLGTCISWVPDMPKPAAYSPTWDSELFRSAFASEAASGGPLDVEQEVGPNAKAAVASDPEAIDPTELWQACRPLLPKASRRARVGVQRLRARVG